MQLEIPATPQVRKDGTYDIEEVLDFAKFVGMPKAAKELKVPHHRLVYFQSKKEGK